MLLTATNMAINFYFCGVMLRKVLAFILLISHMNTSMFLPQVVEQDAYDSTGQQVNDINSVWEFVDEEILGNDSTPFDEDDDNGQNFHLVKTVDYSYIPFFTEAQTKIIIREEKAVPFPQYNENGTNQGYAAILLPPPKA
jgi:hypothetical protein